MEYKILRNIQILKDFLEQKNDFDVVIEELLFKRWYFLSGFFDQFHSNQKLFYETEIPWDQLIFSKYHPDQHLLDEEEVGKNFLDKSLLLVDFLLLFVEPHYLESNQKECCDLVGGVQSFKNLFIKTENFEKLEHFLKLVLPSHFQVGVFAQNDVLNLEPFPDELFITDAAEGEQFLLLSFRFYEFLLLHFCLGFEVGVLHIWIRSQCFFNLLGSIYFSNWKLER